MLHSFSNVFDTKYNIYVHKILSLNCTAVLRYIVQQVCGSKEVKSKILNDFGY